MCVFNIKCVWLTFFFLRLAGSLVCRFLWVIHAAPHSVRPNQLDCGSPPVKNLSIHLQPRDYSGLAVLGVFNPPTPNSSVFVFLSFKPPNCRLLSVSLSLFLPAPCLCVVIESSCDEVTIVHREQFLEEGPGFI